MYDKLTARSVTDRSVSYDERVSSESDLRQIALAEFARSGYAGTSLQRIADLAGLSKSAVLYHFASKEALLEAAIGPAVDILDQLTQNIRGPARPDMQRGTFVEAFVDFLLSHPLEVHLFITQAYSLVDVPVIGRVDELIGRLALYCETSVDSTEDRVRFGIALGGSAYLINTMQTLELAPAPVDEVRAALVTIMSELLAPVPDSLLPAATPGS